MEHPTCPGCRQRDLLIAALQQQVATLEARVRALEERLARNSSNSSVPPSANPANAPAPVVKQPTGRKPGAQPGHPPHLRQRLPAERVQHVHCFVPTHCRHCQAALPAQASRDDPPPTWHQVAELARYPVEVREYQGHSRTCPQCGTLTHAAIPADLKAQTIGPRLTAALAFLTGRGHLGKRALEDIVETIGNVPLALGTISHLERQVSQALAAAHDEIAQAVRQAPAKNVDETGWKRAGRLCWLWTAVTSTATLFVIHAKRGIAGLTALLGMHIGGIISSDRWSAYGQLPLSQRQLCWAHVQRDFQAIAERGGAAGRIGTDLLALTGVLFNVWYQVRDGTRSRRALQRIVADIRADMLQVLQRGSRCHCAPTAATCREILAVEAALWTFVRVEGVEPTNNAAERAVRPAVLWRKRSFGCHSEDGCRFVERLLTVVQTLRRQQRPVLDYLQEAVAAHRAGLPAPKLLTVG
jgi:transposase